MADDLLAGFKFGMSHEAVRDLTRMALMDLLTERTDWDEYPGLHFAYFDDGEVIISRRSIVPDVVWSVADSPVQVLAELAQAASEAVPRNPVVAAIRPEQFFGVVFRAEALAAVGYGATVEDASRAARRRRERRDMILTRTAWAATRVGLLIASQDRGSDQVSADWASPGSGMASNAVTTMFRAFAGTGRTA